MALRKVDLEQIADEARQIFWAVPWGVLVRPAFVAGYGLALAGAAIAAKLPPPLYLSASSVGAALVYSGSKRLDGIADYEEDRQTVREIRRSLIIEAMQQKLASRTQAELLAFDVEVYGNLPAHLRPSHLLPPKSARSEGLAEIDWSKFLEGAAETEGDAGVTVEVPAEAAGEEGTAPNQAAPAVVGGFREVDLATEAAKNDKSFLLSGVSGVGKTQLTRHFIHAVNAEYSGAALFDLVDFKGTTGHFCGLEQTPYYIKSGAAGSNFDAAQSKIQTVVEMLDSRADISIPYYFIADEINNGLEQAKGQPTKKGDRKPEETLRSQLRFIVTQGRERNIRGFFTAHGNLMTLLGIDGDTAQSLVCAVLGRRVAKGDGFALIERVLTNGSSVWFTTSERQRLSAQFKRIRALAEQDGRAIALTNIDGDWELVFLPASYARDPGMVQWQAQNAPTSEVIETTKPQFDPDSLPELGQEFLQYLISKERTAFKTSEVYANWVKKTTREARFPDVLSFKEFLAKLISAGAIVALDAELANFQLSNTFLE